LHVISPSIVTIVGKMPVVYKVAKNKPLLARAVPFWWAQVKATAWRFFMWRENP